jgi:hypothetical protein
LGMRWWGRLGWSFGLGFGFFVMRSGWVVEFLHFHSCRDETATWMGTPGLCG